MKTGTLPDHFREAAAEFSARPAIIDPHLPLSYAGLDQLSDRIASGLLANGIKAGDHVGLYGLNSSTFIAIYIGIQKAGATVVPINLLLNPEEVAYILADAEVKALFYFDSFAPAVSAIRAGLPHIRCFIRTGQNQAGQTDLPEQTDLHFSELLNANPETLSSEIDPEGVAVLLYTSGTTGHPKGAMLTHRNLVSDALLTTQVLKPQQINERFLVVLPMFHAFAAMAGVIIPLLNGCSIIPVQKFEPSLIADLIEKTGATIFLGVPGMYSLLLRLPERHTTQLKNLRFCISGGAALPIEVMHQFEKRFGVLIYEGDGPTECSPVTCVNPIDGLRKPQSVGPAIPGIEMKILDEHGKEKPHGEIGEICVRGPTVMKGYWKHPDETANSFFGEWFRTGDLGTEDDDHYFYIIDRIKDMVIVNGMNVYPRMIEEVLYRHKAVREAAVIGHPSPLHGEIPVACIALKETVQCSENDIRAFCRQHLGRHEVPKKIIFLPELPKNAAGKIIKRELRKRGEIERGVDLKQDRLQPVPPQTKTG
ncbi:MAG: long-chain fatty acid--CoA ligase [Pontiellaceae bacterium]|nr:long-chain fatty acid--CoA ligase [Pontiellaceae bacterium]